MTAAADASTGTSEEAAEVTETMSADWDVGAGGASLGGYLAGRHWVGRPEKQMWKEQLGCLLEVFSAEAKAASCLSHTVLELSLLEGEAG